MTPAGGFLATLARLFSPPPPAATPRLVDVLQLVKERGELVDGDPAEAAYSEEIAAGLRAGLLTAGSGWNNCIWLTPAGDRFLQLH